MFKFFSFITKKNYSKRLSSAMSMFHKAHDKALKLVMRMQQDIDAKNAKIAAINSRIAEIKATQDETNKFINNLEKFMK